MENRPGVRSSGFGLGVQVAGAAFFRLLLNTARRFVYPLAPMMAEAIDVPLTSITSLIAVNQVTAVAGVGLGPVTDAMGYRRTMLAGLGMLAAGMCLAGAHLSWLTLLVALLLAGLGKTVYDPAVQAYASLRVPYHRRGRVIGVLELAWSGSTLVGIPLAAAMIHRWGWQAPLWTMGLMGAAGCLFVRAVFDPDPPRPALGRGNGLGGRVAGNLGRLLRHRPALGVLLFAFWVSVANDNLFIVYGAWLKQRFGMGLLALGMSAGVIGAAELAGELVTAWMADRWGLGRSVAVGLTASAAAYLLLPWVPGGKPGALAGLFVLFVVFEFTMVASISLATELMPGQRATMMAAFFAAAGLGRVAGALAGGWIWTLGGIGAVVVASAVLTLVAGLCLAWGGGKSAMAG